MPVQIHIGRSRSVFEGRGGWRGWGVGVGGAAKVTGIGREYVSPWEKIAALCISPDYRAPLRPDDEELANYPF